MYYSQEVNSASALKPVLKKYTTEPVHLLDALNISHEKAFRKGSLVNVLTQTRNEQLQTGKSLQFYRNTNSTL